MNNLELESIGDELSRSVKLAMDTGEAATPADALRIFEGYRLSISVGTDLASSQTKQVALLTAVNIARRCFLGGVAVEGCPEADLLVPWPGSRSLRHAVELLGGRLTDKPTDCIPRIVIGDGNSTVYGTEFAVRATFDGWSGGSVPVDLDGRLDERNEFSPSGVLAAALCVSEAFQYVRGKNPLAGRRSVGLSLWEPDVPWPESIINGPPLELLPSRLWIIGLGHLGQAYLWTIGFLPYKDPADVCLVLQDTDTLVPANESTSLLTTGEIIGQRKTRAMAAWCDNRGFVARINERRFTDNFRIDEEDPLVALSGVDNEKARSALEDVGFEQVVEAGLGTGAEEYLAFQVHCFPSNRRAKERWGSSHVGGGFESTVVRPAYHWLSTAGMDECGITMLANRAVGAPFVGTFAATLVVAELLRMAHGEHRYQVIDGSLRMPADSTYVRSHLPSGPFNPGVTEASATAWAD